MVTPKKLLKNFIWLFAILLLLLVIIGGIIFFGAQPFINKHLSKYVTEKTQGLYHLHFDKIELIFKEKGFLISGVNLSHDLRLAKKIQKSNAEKVFYSFSSRGLMVDNFDIKNLLLNNNVNIKSISVISPDFKLTGSEQFGNDSIQVFENALKEIKPFFHKYIHKIKVDTIEFIDANYQFFNMIGDTSGISNANNISVGISGFMTDSVLLSNTKKPFVTDDIFVRITGFKNKMSDSIHCMEIDSLEYSLKNTELKAFNFSLFPQISTGENSLYNVFVPEFQMRSKNLSGFKFTDSLDISFLEFKNPEIILTQKNNPRKLNIDDINNFNLYELVKNDFQDISVDSFYLQNATLKIFHNLNDTNYQQKFNNIDIHLLNFKLDSGSIKNENKLLYADDIEMKITDYELNLDDKRHRFNADFIYVSTFSDSIGISGININPINDLNRDAPAILNINCEKLILDNVDLKKVYHRRIIPGSRVEITKPIVLIDNYPDFPKRKTQSGLLFDLVSAYLKGVYSNLIHIEHGSLNIRNYKNNKTTSFFESEFTFSLTDFSLDSSSVNRTDKFFYATNFDLNFSNYKMHLEDNLHKLDVKNINILSSESKVIIDSLRLFPAFKNVDEKLLKKYKRSELYTISIPQITFLNTNLHKAFFNKELNISDFNITNPQIVYENYATLKNKKKRLEFPELYELIFNYINDISISKLTIPSGYIQLTNHSKSGKTITLDNEFSTELKNFRLNKNELCKQKLIFSEQLKFSLKNQLFKLSDNVHYLQAGQIDFSTEDKSIIISNALLYPDITASEYLKIPTTVQVTIPRLTFNKVDLVSAFYSREIEVGSILFEQPKLEVYSQKDRIKTLDLKKFSIPFPKVIESLKIKKLELFEGQVITYQTSGTHKTQSSSFNLDIESEDITLKHSNDNSPNKIKSGNITTNLSNFQLIFDDKSHEIRFNNLNFNQQNKTIELSNLRITPSRYGQSINTFNIKAPGVKLCGFDIDRAYENNDYIFNTIKFNSPEINILLKDSIGNKGFQKFNNINLYEYLEPYFNTLEIEEVSLKNANIDIQSKKGELKQNDINISLKKIGIGKNFNKTGLLNSDGFEFTTFNYSRILDDKNYILKVDTFTFSSLSKKGKLQNIIIEPRFDKNEIALQKGTQVDVVNASIKSIVLNGFNLKKWIKEGAIIGDLMTIGPAEINIFRNKRYSFDKSQRPPWPQQLLTKIKQPFSIDSLIVLPTSITYRELLESHNDPVTIDFSNITMQMGNLSNQNNFQKSKKPLNINARAKIFNKGLITVNIKFDLNDPNFYHEVEGNLSPLNINTFNDIVEKNALLSIEGGKVNTFRFNFNADKNKATGKLFFGYENLKINVMEFRNGNTQKSKLNTFMANNFVIHSKNPKGNTFEPQNINYQRDPSRSILNYWWKSIYSSAKITLGLKNPKVGKK